MAKIVNNDTPPPISLVSAGTEINGKIQASGDIRIDGTLIGSLVSAGKVVIGSTGKLEGDISCLNADISGKVTATMQITELLTLQSSAVLTGNIVTGKLAIEPGALFSGECKMSNQDNTEGSSEA